MDKKFIKIKDVLEKLYAKYNHHRFIPPDPLQFVYWYSNRADREIAGFLAALLAYGRVQQIEKDLTDLLLRMGSNPYEFVMSFDNNKRKRLESFRHRFNTGDDISDLLEILKIALGKYGNIEKIFVQGYNQADKNIIPALSMFCDLLLGIYAENHSGKAAKGLNYLLSRPQAGSACKRLNLFLRWMVRDDQVDTGLWKSIDKAKLIVPVDVHMGRLCRILGFYSRKTVSLSTALEITDSFSKIEPSDPVKYDFALSRIGIVENCTGRQRDECVNCELFGFCFGLEKN